MFMRQLRVCMLFSDKFTKVNCNAYVRIKNAHVFLFDN